MTDLPERRSLNHDRKGGDQRRALRGRDGMQPDGGCDQAERETGNPGDQRAHESRQDEQEEVDRQFAQHLVPGYVALRESATTLG
jgi:hypothetical protein